MNRVLVLAFAVFLLGEVKEVVAEPALPFVPQRFFLVLPRFFLLPQLQYYYIFLCV